MGPQPPQRRSTFLEWNYQAELFAFGKRLNEQFAEEALQQAFTDRSYVVREEARLRELSVESPQLALADNRPLVEAGERLVSDTVRRCLRASLPHAPEECISCAHSHLMSEDVLAKVSSGIGTRDLVLSADFPPEPATLVRSLKAVVGALEASSGRDRAVRFVMDLVVTQLCGKNVYEMWSPEDPLSLVTAILSRRGAAPPEPRLLGQAAPNTILAVYHVGMYSDKQFMGAGWGETVSIAVESAAHNVLQRLFRVTETFRPVTTEQILDCDRFNAPNMSVSEWNK
ncbi:large ribosomal subunit protein mL44 isoform X2 [Bacillus rossius redtenbacheri]